jgi:hypothetical protein
MDYILWLCILDTLHRAWHTLSLKKEVQEDKLSLLRAFHRTVDINVNDKKYRLISFTKFNAQFLYSITICMLHYNPRHVSSINMPIFRRTNCIITESVIRHSLYSTVQYAG